MAAATSLPWLFRLMALLLLLCLPLAGAALCREAAPSADVPSLDGGIDVLVDPTRAMTLDDVLAAEDEFKPIRGSGVNLGYTRDAAWLRMRIPSARDETVLLSLVPNFVDLVDVYVAEERPGLSSGDFSRFESGDERPLPDDGLSGLEDIVPLEMRAGRALLVFVRIAAVQSSLNISGTLHSPSQHTFQVTVGALLSGLWLGSMAALLATQLVFYYFDRRSFYALLALSTFGAMLVYIGNLGLSRLLLFPAGGRANDVFLATAVWFGLAASSLAATSILELPSRYPLMNRVIQAGAAFGVVGMVFAILGFNLVFGPIGTWVALLLATLAMALSVMGARDPTSGARLRAAGYCILWVGAVATLVQRAGLWVLPNWVAHSYAVSCLIQTLLLTASLAVRLRAAEAMNKAMSAQALSAAQAAERHAVALVEERTRELAAAKQVAEDALRAELQSQERQVRFMEVISHQYRTPLASIRSNVDAIGLSLPEHDLDNRKRIDRVRRGIVRFVETLEINLARSRLQGPSFTPHPVRTPVAAFVNAAAARGRDFLQGAIVVDIEPAAEGRYVQADAEMLAIAVLNLLENAVKFSAQNGGAPVHLACEISDGKAVLAVRDRGIGIPADEIDGIVGRSVRGSNARAVEGTGMGLSLVSRIVAAHHGTIEIDSGKGVGTTIRIVLPLLAL
jgi:signal transduction histidine kinase